MKTKPGREGDSHRRMIAMLNCPLTGGSLRFDQKSGELISQRARLAFPIRSGIPIMLASEARPLSEAEIAKIKSRFP